MGVLYYGTSRQPIRMEDRLLAHFKLVLISKLRLHQPFALNWKDDDPHEGRHAIWISSNVELHFHFTEPERPDVDRTLIESLMTQANSPRGVDLLDEATLSPAASRTDIEGLASLQG
jgi:hypothetical protein